MTQTYVLNSATSRGFPATRFSILLLSYCLSVTGLNASEMAHRYQIALTDDLSEMTVTVCPEQPLPTRLLNYYERNPPTPESITLVSGQRQKRLKIEDGAINIPGIQAGDCIHYSLDLDRIGRTGRFRKNLSENQQILLNIHQFLWFPEPLDLETQGLELRFNLPPQVNMSAPWPVVSRGPGFATFRFSHRPVEWDARVAIGRFSTYQREIGAARANIAILNGQPAANENATLAWLDSNLSALNKAYGRLPVPEIQVLVVPIGKNREPVPWGQAMRGGGDAVHLFIDQTRPLDEFLDDWVLIHELSHLLHPRIGSNDPWLYEGFASYYQNVLRARAGLLTPRQAWSKLHSGFLRGMRKTPSNRSLAQISENLSRNHNYMRIYWSGAAIALLADYQLRKDSDGKQSLDSALAAFRQCCLPADRYWGGRELMQKLDSITTTDVFTTLYDTHSTSAKFPDPYPIYRAMGVKASNDGVDLVDSAPDAALRAAIMSGR